MRMCCSVEWQKKLDAQREELEQLEAKLQDSAAELDIKTDLTNSLTGEVHTIRDKG